MIFYFKISSQLQNFKRIAANFSINNRPLATTISAEIAKISDTTFIMYTTRLHKPLHTHDSLVLWNNNLFEIIKILGCRMSLCVFDLWLAIQRNRSLMSVAYISVD